ncbi:hypothetical protein [Nostoc sp. UHCC 0870]|uniref:hypothetical protein n=1 Tax=Nostoc sp. UHCC 0870 TaxID=2914041 RepID=UPI0030DC80E3
MTGYRLQVIGYTGDFTPVPNPQSPVPSPQSPVPSPQSPIPNPQYPKVGKL